MVGLPTACHEQVAPGASGGTHILSAVRAAIGAGERPVVDRLGFPAPPGVATERLHQELRVRPNLNPEWVAAHNHSMSNTSSGPRRRLLRHPAVLVAVAVLLVAAGAAAYWFQPWKVFTNTTVEEAFPTAASGLTPSPGTADDRQEPQVIKQGTLISQEHATSGTVKLLRLPDGTQVVRVEDLDTSDGPQLVVLLSDAAVTEGKGGSEVFDQGRYVDLGPLKGNRGNANYPVPSDANLAGLDSVSIWCKRFGVSFGAAALSAPTGTS